ncbi:MULTISPECIES: hypothetical protein [Methylobacterium]|uniref:DUF2946 domain-containing protein n=1 Tax=Methylobacterium jeotgali TaxID=381630 RepID=A0ABQ4SP52_9HYPH|nr:MULTISPECIES: hypothetical protein [Methylobacterium]PIU08648.1 MAG: hypothetical protein COT56_00540 [Methylobacterium sp. CG09_land_8_20_14_0_10_71_15]PIU15928.1 MAG: hypothetical protein COT28_02150 [Methylobacterium sp. CG08_land_8_20_14_0_20_71_15]GBU17681.1 hypothetical protein AwMethylo_18960 [Methylobacterium sp.]GJE04857.1 hypothetical protein AOPFMNJM_0149 [Methylobacterium jeotgali]
MTATRRHGAFGALTGWWASAARALALVLALAVAAPTAGLAEDLAYHQDHPGHAQTERAFASSADAGGSQTADPGLGCHVHCGCHAGIALDEAASAPLPSASRPRYERVSLAAASIFPDRLPRPPRA